MLERLFILTWLLRERSKLLRYFRGIEEDQIVLDVGCFNKWPRAHISDKCSYIGLDYYQTAKDWYESVPDVYGDALKLPIRSETINIVLLLDVLEHVSDSDGVLSEIWRVLEPDGRLIMQVPFLYPLHDEPRDYVRFTAHGFRALAGKHDFVVEECNSMGQPIETSALLANIAFSKTIVRWIEDKNPAAILVVLLPLFVLLSNSLARIVGFLSNADYFMPHSYQLVFRKGLKQMPDNSIMG